MSGKTPAPLPLTTLTAITPLDGRYRKDLATLSPFFSEYALIMTRVYLEIEYLLVLSKHGVIRKFTDKEKAILETIAADFTLADAQKVKKSEEKTRHDVKAVELFLREKLQDTSLSDIVEMVHFGITSEDINNLAIRHMLRRSVTEALLPELLKLLTTLKQFASEEKKTGMLARTHGQPAVPTTLGKELAVFSNRLEKELVLLSKYQLTGKMTGAVGNLNALVFALPKMNWQKVAEEFVSALGFENNPVTIQINPYDDVIAYFQIIERINNILLNLSQDMWRYVSDGWLVQEVKTGEVGSSTMPQKVNPIFFENAEGNIGLANALIEFFTRKLSVTRLQRDLSDSTVTRNLGIALGYSLIAYHNLSIGLSRVKPNREKMRDVLNEDWSILSEAAQTILRLEGITDAYMLVKALSRGQHVDQEGWQSWVSALPVPEEIKKRLNELTPETYIGLAEKITEQTAKEKK